MEIIRINPEYKGDSKKPTIKSKINTDPEKEELEVKEKQKSNYQIHLEMDAEDEYKESKSSLSKEKYIRLFKLQKEVTYRNKKFYDGDSYRNHLNLKNKTKEELEKIFDEHDDNYFKDNPSFTVPFLNILKEKSKL